MDLHDTGRSFIGMPSFSMKDLLIEESVQPQSSSASTSKDRSSSVVRMVFGLSSRLCTAALMYRSSSRASFSLETARLYVLILFNKNSASPSSILHKRITRDKTIFSVGGP